MRVCPNCKTEYPADSADFCQKCGTKLSPTNDNLNSGPDDDLEFVITETPGGQFPDMTGPDKDDKSTRTPKSGDSIEITSAASLLQESSTGEIDLGVDPEKDIKQAEADNKQPKEAEEQFDFSDIAVEPPEKDQQPEAVKEPEPPPSKLSDEELAAVRRNLYGSESPPIAKASENHAPANKPKEMIPGGGHSSEGLQEPPMAKTPENHAPTNRPEKATPTTVHSTEDFQMPPIAETPESHESTNMAEKATPAGVRSIEDPAKTNSNIKKAQKVRGLAHFRGNVIKIVGNPFFHDGDEITINDKPYLLKPWKLDKRVIFGTAAAFLVIVLSIITIQIISNGTLSGDGEIVGMILDDNGRPFLEKARVTIPSLNKSTTSNAQGFFIFQNIPTGTYELDFELGPDVIYSGNATVTSNQLTLIAFNDLEPVLPPEEAPTTTTASASTKKTEPRRSPEKERKATSSEKKEVTDSGKKTSSKYGKIKLNANVENARLIVDDRVLGAGNNTYSQIKPGSRKIEITKDGYETYTQTANITAGNTVTISARLSPEEPTRLSGKDYLSLGKDALASKDYKGAISKLTQAINLTPSLVDAYESRAVAYKKTGDADKAAADYVRAGEIIRFKKDYTRAISNFSSALALSEDNNSALIGRGGAEFDQGDYRSAMDDFDAALRNDMSLFGAQYGMAKCYYKMGEPKKAEKYFKAAHQLDPADPELYQYMMLNYLARDDIKKVREMYAEFKIVADPAQLAEFKSSSRYEPIVRLIAEENR